jgi:hypothetical protein
MGLSVWGISAHLQEEETFHCTQTGEISFVRCQNAGKQRLSYVRIDMVREIAVPPFCCRVSGRT